MCGKEGEEREGKEKKNKKKNKRMLERGIYYKNEFKIYHIFHVSLYKTYS